MSSSVASIASSSQQTSQLGDSSDERFELAMKLDSILVELETLKGRQTGGKKANEVEEVKEKVKRIIEVVKADFYIQLGISKGRVIEMEKKIKDKESGFASERASFSSALRNGIAKDQFGLKKSVISEKKQANVVMIYPTQDMTSQALKDTFKRSLEPGKKGINIESIENIRKGGILVKCQSEENCKKLVKEVNENNNNNKLKLCSKASIPAKKNPLMIIHDLHHEMFENEMNEVLDAKEKMIKVGDNLKVMIYDQNDDLTNAVILDPTESEKFDVKFLIKKDGKVKSAVVEVTPNVRKLLLVKKRLFVEFGRTG
jgi:hypothetical protein